MSSLKVGRFTLGVCATNSYYVFDEEKTDSEGFRHAVFFDPADKGDKIYEELYNNKILVDLILLTHGHFDHILGAEKLRELSGAEVVSLDKEQALCGDVFLNLSNQFGGGTTIVPDRFASDGETITAAGFSVSVIATPGHTSGGCCYYFKDEGILMSGDTLFEESVGRTDFPTSSLSELVRSIKEKLFILPDDTIVYPGHGDVTTIGHEKQYNPFVV